MADYPSTTNIIAKAIGTVTIGMTAGASIGISHLTMPTIIRTSQSTSHLLLQWRELYEMGKRRFPFIYMIPTICFAYVSYDTYKSGDSTVIRGLSDSSGISEWKYWALASVSSIAGAPFTLTVMKSTLNTLNNFSQRANALDGKTPAEPNPKEVEKQLWKFSNLNYCRATFTAAGFFLAMSQLLRR